MSETSSSSQAQEFRPSPASLPFAGLAGCGKGTGSRRRARKAINAAFGLIPLRTLPEWVNFPSMDFSDVDPVIERWVARLGSTLFCEWNGEPARYFHVPGDPPFECFQISVERAEPYKVAVHARAIDTNDDTENDLERSWTGAPAQLDAMLASASEVIDDWKVRTRTAPDPPSPW